MFWGLVMEPSKLYSQIVERPFHISQAALDSSTGDNELCQVMVSVDGKKFLICTLQKRLSVQVPLDLYFKAGECIAFVTNGKCNIHLTGYLDPEFEEEEEEEDNDEEEEENVSSKKRKALNDVSSKHKKAKNSAVVTGSDSHASTLKQLLDSEDMDSDEDDESFIANTSAEADDTSFANTTTEADSDDENSDDDDSDEDSEVPVANGFCSTDTKGDAEVDMSKLTKSQRKRLKKKLSKVTEAKPKVNGVRESSEIKKTKESKELKKKEVKIEKKEPQKVNKTITGGVQIEDLKVGDGQLAKAGKVVMVYYQGRLKKNNKTFDKCSTGPGFKFRLGAKEVISGWDIGVAGMRSGGVRKIVCPPSMAYGAKGSPPVIPPNSTLVFEVELKNVK